MKTKYAEKCVDPIFPKTHDPTRAVGEPAKQTTEIEMTEITPIQKPLIGNRTTGLVNHNYKL